MKRFLNQCFSLSLIASMFLVSSCGQDPVEPVVPEIAAPTVTGPEGEAETTVDVGVPVAFKVKVNAEGGFNVLVIEKTVEGGETEEIGREMRENGVTPPTSFEYDFTYTPTAEEAGKEVVFDFVAVDEEDREGKYTYTVNVKEIPYDEYTAVLLGGQLHTTVESFYNVVENKRYFYSGANEQANRNKVDFVFHYGETNKNVLSSPDDVDTRKAWADTYKMPLTNLNNSTRFKRVPSTVSYDQITTNAQIMNAYLENNPNPVSSRLTQLQAGETFAFVLDDERGQRYGVVKVVSTQGATGAERTITLNVKVQATNNN